MISSPITTSPTATSDLIPPATPTSSTTDGCSASRSRRYAAAADCGPGSSAWVATTRRSPPSVRTAAWSSWDPPGSGAERKSRCRRSTSTTARSSSVSTVSTATSARRRGPARFGSAATVCRPTAEPAQTTPPPVARAPMLTVPARQV